MLYEAWSFSLVSTDVDYQSDQSSVCQPKLCGSPREGQWGVLAGLGTGGVQGQIPSQPLGAREAVTRSQSSLAHRFVVRIKGRGVLPCKLLDAP